MSLAGGQMALRIGYAAGGFDLFHVGHLNLLRHAKSQCDVLIAGVVSDEVLREVKGIEPVIPTEERVEIVRHISFVDHVHVESTPSKMDAWRDVHFTHFFKGDDWPRTQKRHPRPPPRPPGAPRPGRAPRGAGAPAARRTGLILRCPRTRVSADTAPRPTG